MTDNGELFWTPLALIIDTLKWYFTQKWTFILMSFQICMIFFLHSIIKSVSVVIGPTNKSQWGLVLDPIDFHYMDINRFMTV